MINDRVQLSDDMVEGIAGGNIQFVNNGTDRYAWGSHSPEKKYSFPSKKAMVSFVSANYDELGERGCIEEMVAQGILIPMN